jgi:hypothetical protein
LALNNIPKQTNAPPYGTSFSSKRQKMPHPRGGGGIVSRVSKFISWIIKNIKIMYQKLVNYNLYLLPWFQRFIFIIFIAKGRGKINLWFKAAIDSSRANQFELGSDPDSVS